MIIILLVAAATFAWALETWRVESAKVDFYAMGWAFLGAALLAHLLGAP